LSDRGGSPSTWYSSEATGVPTRNRIRGSFYVGAAVGMIAISILGFAPSVLDRSARHAPPTILIGAHGFVLSSWLGLLLVQATLVASGRTDLHRRLGRVAAVLAPAIIVLGFLVLRGFALRGYDLSGDIVRSLSGGGVSRPDPSGLLFPLSELFTFGVLVALAIVFRGRPEIHKRLMILAVIPLLGEPLVHLVGHVASSWPAMRGTGARISVPLVWLLGFGCAIHDRVSRGRIHPVSLWVPIGLVAWQIFLGAVVLRSTPWRVAAAWLFG
jgi:hypothetical protein